MHLLKYMHFEDWKPTMLNYIEYLVVTNLFSLAIGSGCGRGVVATAGAQ